MLFVGTRVLRQICSFITAIPDRMPESKLVLPLVQGPVLGIRGPLEGSGLMLHGAVTIWVDSVEEALAIVSKVAAHAGSLPQNLHLESEAVCRLCQCMRRFRWVIQLSASARWAALNNLLPTSHR